MEDFPHHSTHRDNQEPAANTNSQSTDGTTPALDSEAIDVLVILLVLGAAAWLGYQFIRLVFERCRTDDEQDGQPRGQQPDSSTSYPIFRL